MNKIRIFMGLREVAGYYSNLKKGFDALGIASDLYTNKSHPFSYHYSKKQNYFIKIFNAVNKVNGCLRKNPNKITNFFFNIIDVAILFILFLFALIKYNVFIFGAKKCFFYRIGFWDLPILKFFNKKIIFVFHGSDAHPPYLNGSFLFKKGNDNHDKILRMTRKIKKDIILIERYADIIINNPPSSYFNEKKIISFLRIGIPYEKYLKGDSIERIDRKKIKILHSPSNPRAKGTEKIREIINSLKRKGYGIDYIEITGQPNSVVIRNIRLCDFVIDQLYSTTPMPGFATEASSYGKPVVIGGYYYDEIKKDLPVILIPPTYYCHPDKVEQAIEKLIVDKNYRLSIGKKAEEFVKTYWSARSVAERYLTLIKGDIPKEWYYDPTQINNLHCLCLPEKKAIQTVKMMIDLYGRKSLFLSDKPDLEQMIYHFADKSE